MRVWYYDETGREIQFNVHSTDELYSVAQQLLDAPIDINCLYSDKNTFNLNTFEWN